VFDGVFAYEAMVDAPTYAPTVDVAGLKVASATFVPVADAHIDRGDPDGTFGRDALLEVQGGGAARKSRSCSSTWGRSTGRRNKRRARSYARL